MTAISLSLRVTSGGRDTARVAVRRQQFSVGRPLEFDEASPRISALEYALGAVGGEVVNGLQTFAWRRRLTVNAIEAVVTGTIENGLTYLEVVGEAALPVIAGIHVKVFVAADDETATRRLFEGMLEKLPLVGTLRKATSITIQLIFTP